MSAKKEKAEKANAASTNGKPSESAEKHECFVIMPFSDAETYEEGHFGRVYEYIIKPACLAAGFEPVRADEVQVTNYIVIDILKKILRAEMVVCDLSSRNPNVLYELGIRQAFNLPVTLIKDSKTAKIFDIQGLRYLEYDESLRVDKIKTTVESLTDTLKNNAKLEEGDVNSIVQLLGIRPAKLQTVEVSKETSLLLEAINDIGSRLARVEENNTSSPKPSQRKFALPTPFFDRKLNVINTGSRVILDGIGEGLITDTSDGMISLTLDSGGTMYFPINGPTAKKLEKIPE